MTFMTEMVSIRLFLSISCDRPPVRNRNEIYIQIDYNETTEAPRATATEKGRLPGCKCSDLLFYFASLFLLLREPELILGYDSRLVVETRCVTPGSQGDEAVPHPGPRRLCQIQQAVWELEIVDPSVESVAGSGSV